MLATAPVAAPAPAAAEPSLRARGDHLFLTAPPDRFKRGELLYVLDPQPLHNDTRLRIGLVQVVSATENTVTWYCRPRSPVDAALAGQGLPVAEFKSDTRLRAGKCWGGYDAPGSAAQAGTVVDLSLHLGPGDGVRPHDLYEVLGEPVVDRDGRAVLGFEPLGHCTVLPFEGTTLTSLCRIDRAVWPKFDAKAMARPGFVKLLQEAPPDAP
ncbi:MULTISPECIES: hypothetical protein [Sorangium]|uniref:hypothetical protein n=1 Tax=Sorangium TaxID=39643 RepID=UPI00101A978C|nr:MULTISPECIES: hypothetical protein [Sorangium]